MTKRKYIITTESYLSDAIPVEWRKFPDELIDNLPGKYLFNVFSCNTEGEIIEKTVIYLQPTSRFSKDITKVN